MNDKRNPDYPPYPLWDSCSHEWEDVESMMDRAVECTKCGVPGQRQLDDTVYWPAT